MTGEWTAELEGWLREQVVEAGFDTVGVVPVSAPESDENHLDAERFAAWISAGRAGEMEYLKRRDEQGQLLRSSVRVAMPWARSVIVCAMNYNTAELRSIDPAALDTGWIAKYAWSGRNTDEALIPTDYHDELWQRLRRIETALQQRVPCETRCYVDTGPLVERTIAAKAGIGWIGKNTCVINQQLGSWLLLGVIVTSIPVAEGAALNIATDRCGSCTRCIEACPTDALIAPRQMDASRCIAYLTIEKKGSIAEDLREPMGRQVFGCDICQDVCPWNRRAPIAAKPGMMARQELINPALDWLAQMDAPAFRRWFAGSPLERTRRKRLHRNVAIAMGNSGDKRFLPQLEEWIGGEDEVLVEASQWASKRIRSRSDESGMATSSETEV